MDAAPFWRDTPLTEPESRLWNALMQAHHNSVFRPNISSEVARAAGAGSGDVAKALSAAISTIGGRHAPLAQTYALLELPDPGGLVDRILDKGALVPGWGNSFHRAQKDPLWLGVEALLRETNPAVVEKLEKVTERLHARGKNVFPNPSAYTVAAALTLGIPATLLPFVFIQGRLLGWMVLAAKEL